MTEKLKVLWADNENLRFSRTWTDLLVQTGLFKIDTLPSVATKHVLALCPNRDIIVIHSGTNKPIANLEELVLGISNGFPDTAICLKTETIRDSVSLYVHGYISTVPDNVDELIRGLQDSHDRMKRKIVWSQR